MEKETDERCHLFRLLLIRGTCHHPAKAGLGKLGEGEVFSYIDEVERESAKAIVREGAHTSPSRCDAHRDGTWHGHCRLRGEERREEKKKKIR